MKKVLITDVTSGLGEATANLALSKKYEVYAIGNSNNKTLRSRAGYHYFPLNFNDVEMLKENSKKFLKDHRFDLVILNRTIIPDIMEIDQTSLYTFQEVMDREVWSNKQLIDILDIYAKVRQVVAISSKEAISCYKGWGAYSVAKTALNALIKTYASEKPWTHFSAIDPGVVITPELKKIFENGNSKIFPSINKIREGSILTPRLAAQRLLLACETAIEYKSGSFLDTRNMEKISNIIINNQLR
jgi:NAD(P)-dependent dehydrogenase (short-subunit alcohol dehydrogenase family)